jgi:hypothetical protein
MESISLTEPFKVGGPVAITIRLKNTGKTPAIRITVIHNFGFISLVRRIRG